MNKKTSPLLTNSLLDFQSHPFTNSKDQINTQYDNEEPNRIVPIVEKILEILESKELLKSQQPSQTPKKKHSLFVEDAIFLKKKNYYCRVNFTEILFITAEGDYCEFSTKTKKFLHKIRFGLLQDLLPNNFIRIHRSRIINLQHLEKFSLQINQLSVHGHTLSFAKKYKSKMIDLIF